MLLQRHHTKVSRPLKQRSQLSELGQKLTYGYSEGDTVLILGGGPIALSVVFALLAKKAQKIIVAEVCCTTMVSFSSC